MQGTRFVVSYDPSVVSYLGASAGALVTEEVFLRVLAGEGGPDVNAAALGAGATLGTGELAVLRFRCEAEGAVALKVEEATARDTANEDLLLSPSDVVVGPQGVVPKEVYLAASRPNPVSSAGTIGFGLPQAGTVKLAVYDVSGRQVRLLAEGLWPAGEHRVSWDRRDAAGQPVSGWLYFYRLEANGRALTRKLVVSD